SQYGWIEHVCTSSFFGYILALEAAASTFCQSLSDTLTHLYGPKACSFLRVHAEDDPDHTEKALSFIEKLSAAEQEHVIQNMLQTASLYAFAMARIAHTSISKEPLQRVA